MTAQRAEAVGAGLPSWVIPDGAAGCIIRVKVVPGAKRPEVVGPLGDRLKVRVAAPPEDGKANAAVEALLAKELALNARDVSIAAGHGQPQKSVRVACDAATAAARLIR
ncbi:MAG: DUF167 domain-containing protein [Planctomycetota bacterium]|nr:DUF167 domain-containing protein [Planctomycetota bacterium]